MTKRCIWNLENQSFCFCIIRYKLYVARQNAYISGTSTPKSKLISEHSCRNASFQVGPVSGDFRFDNSYNKNIHNISKNQKVIMQNIVDTLDQSPYEETFESILSIPETNFEGFTSYGSYFFHISILLLPMCLTCFAFFDGS